MASWKCIQYTYHHIPFFCMGSVCVCKNISTLWSTFQKTTLLLAMIKTNQQKTLQNTDVLCIFSMYTTWKGSMAIATPTSLGWSWPLTFRHRTWEWLAIAIYGLRKRCMLIWVYQFQDKEPSWWCQPICKNMLVKLDHFCQGSGWKKKICEVSPPFRKKLVEKPPSLHLISSIRTRSIRTFHELFHCIS